MTHFKVDDVLHLSAVLPSISDFWRRFSCLTFPLPRTRANCVRAAGRINYLLMLTFEEDVSFVLTPTARVGAVFTSPSCCHDNRQNLAVRKRGVCRVTFRNPNDDEWMQSMSGFCAFLLCYTVKRPECESPFPRCLFLKRTAICNNMSKCSSYISNMLIQCNNTMS